MEVTTFASFIMNGNMKYNNSIGLMVVMVASTHTTNSNKKLEMMQRHDFNYSNVLLSL
jgi:hypothetical protein